MSEIECKTEAYGVDYVCDACGKGRMRPTSDTMLMSHPPMWYHECNNAECDAPKVALTERYPTVRFRIS